MTTIKKTRPPYAMQRKTRKIHDWIAARPGPFTLAAFARVAGLSQISAMRRLYLLRDQGHIRHTGGQIWERTA